MSETDAEPRRPLDARVGRMPTTPSTSGADSAYRGDIDGLRAVAVAAVVLFHAAPSILPGGFVGVDIFFVISGYLITGIILSKLEQGRFSYLEFFGRRVRRIGPALVVVVLASLAIGFFVVSHSEFRALGRQAIAASAFSANILFWLQSGYFDGLADSKPLLHLWSLGVEEQFYLVWPALMTLAVLLGARWWAVVLSIIVLSFASNVALIGTYPDAVFYLLPGRLWELGLGGVLARHHGRRTGAADHARANLKSGLGLALIAVSVSLIDKDSIFPGWLALLPTLGAMLVIDAGPGAWANRHVLASAPFRGIGLISYPIYLWHWPLLVFPVLAGWEGQVWTVGAVILAVLLAYLTYRYVEVPIRFGRRTGRRSAAFVVPAILAGMLLAAGLGQVAPVWQRHALRLPDWAIKDYHLESVVAYREGRCFLTATQTAVDFVADCDGGSGAALPRSRPLVMLWGDSHAAHLYPGLLAQWQRAEGGFALAQFTASGCPPIFGVSVDFRQNCHGVVDGIAGTIARMRPDTVIMAADWCRYANARKSSFEPAGITETVRRLHAMGVAHVIVVGPVPSWDLPLPDALLHEMPPGAGSTPEYLRKHLSAQAFKLDATIRDAALAGGGRYVSATEALCDDRRGCLATVATAHGPMFTSFDTSHFTAAGSIAFIGRIWDGQIAPDM